MNHTSYQSIMSPAYATSLGQACQAYEKIPKISSRKTEHIKVNFRLHTLKRIYTAASSSGHLPPPHRTDHYMKHKSLVGAFKVRCSSHRSSSIARKLPALAIARSGFEPFRLCHGHYIMGIRSCELSEPQTNTDRRRRLISIF